MFPVKRILIPCDFSRFSDAAVSRASDLAATFDAGLHLLHVMAEPSLIGRTEPDADRLRRARERLDQQLDPLIMVQRRVERVAVIGTPHREICRYAREHDIDLIVMGTHGRTGLAHAAIGSVSEKVLRAAPCPVLIVRHPDVTETLARQAADVLRDQIGATLAGEFSETRAALKAQMARTLAMSEETAELVMERLQSEERLVWEESATDGAAQPSLGTWRIAPRESAAAAPDAPVAPVVPVDEASPALDLISRALALRATDIHIDPIGSKYSVRFRIDGRLQRYCELDEEVASHLIQRYKTLARLDIADPFHPQEGRLRLPATFTDLEIRLTTSPVASGDAVALRLLDAEKVFRPLDRLGLSQQSIAAIDEMLRRAEGLVLVTGPTGSGKTTTVYSMLQSLGGGERNIVSIEDPVEFPSSFVRQMEVDERHGVTMTSGLRVLLRMDPDVIFIGEIRNAEAADIGMRAASSGRYVLSTLHTRDVASTVTALRDLHVDSRSLSGNLTGIISQRLVRRLCPQCRRAVPVGEDERGSLLACGIAPPEQLFEAVGCVNCRGTGYRGRVGVFEAVVANEAFSREIGRGAKEQDLRELLRRGGTPDLMSDVMAKVCDGTTSFAEATGLRAV